MTSVRDFGAVGDGRTDDTAAIEHALHNGEGSLVFPRGEYRITRTITIDLHKTNRTSIEGSGGTATLVMAAEGPALFFSGSHTKTADPTGFSAGIWERQRMPCVRSIEIIGDHPLADGIRFEGVMQPTLSHFLVRRVRHAIHITGRARNLLIDHCHLYHNTGIGVFLDHVNLHQAIITGSHISYCRQSGVRIAGGEIRNLQITGNDIEYNNNRSFNVPGADAEPTAEIYIDVEDGSIREGTIASNTLQATYSPGGANIRFIGSSHAGNYRAGMWTICGNLIGSQAINIHLTSTLGMSLSGNYLYSGHRRNIVVERSRSISLGANTIGHNSDYGNKELSTGIRFEDCEDCAINGLVVQDALAGQTTVADAIPSNKEALVEIIRCRRMTLCGSQILEGTPVGILVEDSHDTVISGCMVLDQREPKQMQTAILWRTTPQGASPWGCLIQGCRLQNLDVPEVVHQSGNVLG